MRRYWPTISANFRQGIIELVQGGLTRDTRRIVRAMRQMGFVAKNADERVFEQGRKAARVRWEKQPGEPVREEVLFVRVDKALRELLRERTLAVQKANPQRTVSEAEVVREILYRDLKPPA